MLKGSEAFATIYNKTSQSIAVNSPVLFDTNNTLKNIEHTINSPNITVNKSGYYSIIVSLNVVEASQFTIFVNGVEDINTTTSSPSGQVVIRQILKLRDRDSIQIRNFTSSIGTVNLALPIGGLDPATGSNAKVIICMIAPLESVDN
jgi:hypothetical protein